MTDPKANTDRDAREMDEGPAYKAPALDKGLDILEFLSAREQPYTLPALGAELGRSKNEIYRMALALERRGYLARTPDDRFFLTRKLFEIGMRNPPLRNLNDAALPVMHCLAEEFQQSCHLAVESGSDIVVVARVESPGQLGFAVRVGYRRPIASTASGIILAAWKPTERQQALLARAELTRAEKALFEQQVAEAREHGFHSRPSSHVEAIIDISAPIFDGVSLGAAAALTMPFLRDLRDGYDFDEAVRAVRKAAEEISATLQHG